MSTVNHVDPQHLCIWSPSLPCASRPIHIPTIHPLHSPSLPALDESSGKPASTLPLTPPAASIAASADRRDSALSAASATSATSASSGHPGVNNEHLKAKNLMYGWLGKIKPFWG
ncbi:hypothetical protein JCM24511_09737 [Saitozyma sp. JCM 24511]|nr:hypothetical protein JCM24511_09737 [Saitozyma sp. JCM 24511]